MMTFKSHNCTSLNLNLYDDLDFTSTLNLNSDVGPSLSICITATAPPSNCMVTAILSTSSYFPYWSARSELLVAVHDIVDGFWPISHGTQSRK